jgi:Amt family ammonium transporter
LPRPSFSRYTGLIEGNVQQLVNQLIAVAATIAYAVVATFVIVKVVDAVLGIRVKAADEAAGLDPLGARRGCLSSVTRPW